MTGAELIAKERQRQIDEEKWTAEHDDEHTDGSLALAAVCYATPVRLFVMGRGPNTLVFTDPWPESWDLMWDKRHQYGANAGNPDITLPEPETYQEDERLDLLVKAGALLAAEIDRRMRAQAQIDKPT